METKPEGASMNKHNYFKLLVFISFMTILVCITIIISCSRIEKEMNIRFDAIEERQYILNENIGGLIEDSALIKHELINISRGINDERN